MYVLLVWFASDNVMGWLSSPILFYPIMMIATALGVCYQLGLMPILQDIWLPVFTAKANKLLEGTPLAYRL